MAAFFRPQKAESFSRARRGRTGYSQPFTRHHVGKPADPVEIDCIGRCRDHALNDLAAALASGTGTTVDKAQAAELFQRAAERGHSRAAANLANLSQ